MHDAIKAIVALAGDVKRYEIESLFANDKALEVLDYAEGADDWQRFLAQPSDIVIVACGEYSELTTDMVDRAVKQRPDRPVVVLAQGSPNGLLRQAFEAGADDVLALPQSPEGIRFAL
jgi:CheY-like chemotaxis protein